MRSALLALPTLLALPACGAPRAAPDATSDASADAAPVAPTPPAPPAPLASPVFGPCPPGWRTVTSASGVETCDPWPETGYRTDCAWDEAHWPGTSRCTRVGTACPADGWPEGLPAGRPIVYVDDDAAPGGDGSSRARAYRTIAEASAAARSGAIVAIATGRYDESVRVGAGVTVWGACVSGTRIVTSATSETDAALTFVASSAAARNLGIDAPERRGIASVGREGVSVEAVAVRGARDYGFFLSGGSVTVRDVVVRGIRERASNRSFGRGINVQRGAHVTLSRVVVEESREVGIFASNPVTSVEATDVVVRGTRERASDGSLGRGIDVEPGAHVTLSRAVVEDNRDNGISAAGADARIEATDVVVRGMSVRVSDRMSHRGINIQSRAHVTLSRAVVEDNREAGIFAAGADARLAATDVVVRGTRERPSDGTAGIGIDVEAGAHVTLTRAVVEDNRECGILAGGVDASIEATDVLVRATRERASDRARGRGIHVEAGGHVTLSRAVVEDNREGGIGADGIDARIDAADVVVRGTRERASDRMLGRGMNVQNGAHVALSRAVVEDNREHGIFADEAGTNVEATDVVVRGTRERASDRTLGRGINAQNGAQVTLSRAVFDDNRNTGIFAGSGARVDATHIVVRGTRERAADGTAGRGIEVGGGAHVTLARAVVEDNRDHGIFASGVDVSIEATDVLVRDTMPRASDGSGGDGVWSQSGARVVLDRVGVERSHMVGIGSFGGASVEASDVAVTGVEPSRCPSGLCTGESGGFGLVANYGGTVRATGFAVVGATLCGVLVGGNIRDLARTGMDLESGVIQRSEVGACVQVDGYDLSRLRRDVQYRDVVLPTQATSYSLPEAL